MYNEKVMEHFQNPKNVGEIKDADGIGEVMSEACGDSMKVFIKVKDHKVNDIKFKTYGCCAAIASSSIATEMVKGKDLNEIKRLTKQDIVNELGGLPNRKIHCSLLAEDAIKAAVKNYEEKNNAE